MSLKSSNFHSQKDRAVVYTFGTDPFRGKQVSSDCKMPDQMHVCHSAPILLRAAPCSISQNCSEAMTVVAVRQGLHIVSRMIRRCLRCR